MCLFFIVLYHLLGGGGILLYDCLYTNEEAKQVNVTKKQMGNCYLKSTVGDFGRLGHVKYNICQMKKRNNNKKQCLFDTPRTVMVNKEMSEYLDHKNNCVCPIIAQS